MLNPCEKAKFEAAGDLYQFQGMRRGGERKRHLKEVLGVKHQLWNVLTVVQQSLKSEQKECEITELRIKAQPARCFLPIANLAFA